MSEPAIPLVDLSRPREQITADLLRSYGGFGFAHLVGHGIGARLVDEVFAASRRFHALPAADKLAIELDDRHRGYIPINSSTDRNSELAKVTRPNQSASFMMMREDGPDSPEVAAGTYLAGPNQWPSLPGFRPVLEAYHDAMVELGRDLMTIFFDALGADGADLVEQWFRPPTTWLRLLHYPPQLPDPDLYGSAPHVDYGAITILAQDDAGGLQVRSPDGAAWLDVSPIPGSFVLNTGSMLRRWSNGRLRATPHRVINRSGRERYSVPFFFDPHVSVEVAPLGTCVDDEHPARYPPITFGDFLRAELTAGYDHHASTPLQGFGGPATP